MAEADVKAHQSNKIDDAAPKVSVATLHKKRYIAEIALSCKALLHFITKLRYKLHTVH